MSITPRLDLLPGDWVEVRSADEILSTLDDRGACDGLVFMPEMLAFCGRRMQVYSRSDKTCDTIDLAGMMRMHDTVHLRGARCGGTSHGGCQAACLMFWKEAWLRPSSSARQLTDGDRGTSGAAGSALPVLHDRAWLESLAVRQTAIAEPTHYRCQATEIKSAAFPIKWWEPTQYVRDVRANGVPLWSVIRSLAIYIYNRVMLRIGGRQYPHVAGRLRRTPVEVLDLRPGEWVVVKSRDEIVATLDATAKNRGMSFEAEMLPYCGKRYRVAQRVDQIIEESSGRMKKLGSVGIILEDVICASAYRTPCPRANYLYWREIWLRRAEPDELPAQPQDEATCALQTLSH
jgi:hypothetical protein